MSGEQLSIAMLAATCAVLLTGFPVAFCLAGTSLMFAYFGAAIGVFDMRLLGSLPSRFFGVMTNEALVAVPLFIFMGVMLERSGIADQLLVSMSRVFGRLRGGIGYSVTIVGMLLAASTGIVGATVVTMGLLSLPTMLRAGYDPKLATGVICAAGTLGQIIPPSIVLVILGDILQGANAEAQLALGNFAPEPVSVVDLFAGALLPGLLLVGLYLCYQIAVAALHPALSPAIERPKDDQVWQQAMVALVPPVVLMILVLGSILFGLATPTESAAVGAVGATGLAFLRQRLTWRVTDDVLIQTMRISAMIFVILLGASVFSLVFRGLGGDGLVIRTLENLPGGLAAAMLLVMALMFVLGFFLDFIEIVFVVVPIVGPVLLMMGADPVWLGIMIAINLQTSFLTPPFGFALFYLRGVAPDTVMTIDIYRGIIPFVGIQIIGLSMVALWPELATWLPAVLLG